MTLEYSVIIPVFNEVDSIRPLADSLMKTLDPLEGDYEIIFIDDGSRDGSSEVLADLSKQFDKVKVVSFNRNYGQTAAMMAGFDYAGGEIIIPLDGDMQNDPADIPLLIKHINEGADVCSGWRVDRQDASFRRVLPSKIANWLISKVSGVHLHDYGCSLKAYRASVLKGVRLYGEMHRFIPIYASWQGGKITECPVNHYPRKHGESKYGLERIFKVLLDLIVVKFLGKYQQKPIYVFGGAGLAAFFVSLLLFLWMLFLKYAQDTSFIMTPLPNLVTIFFLSGLQFILIGIVAELLIRTYFESQRRKPYHVEKTINVAEPKPSAETRRTEGREGD